MLNIAVLASGGGTNLQSIIDAVESGKLRVKISVVISDKAGAGALERAARHGIATCVITRARFPDRAEYDRELVKELKSNDAGLIVLAGFMRILTPVLINAFPMRIINIHPSLLPSFPGLNVQKKAIEHGARFSGATVHFVDQGVDTGPVIIQAVVPILPGDTPESLAARILRQEHRIYPEAIALFSEGRLEIDGRRVIIKHASPALENDFLTNPATREFKDAE